MKLKALFEEGGMQAVFHLRQGLRGVYRAHYFSMNNPKGARQTGRRESACSTSLHVLRRRNIQQEARVRYAGGMRLNAVEPRTER